MTSAVESDHVKPQPFLPAITMVYIIGNVLDVTAKSMSSTQLSALKLYMDMEEMPGFTGLSQATGRLIQGLNIFTV